MTEKEFIKYMSSYIRLHEFNFVFFDDDPEKNDLIYRDEEQMNYMICEVISICTEVMWRIEEQLTIAQRRKLKTRLTLEANIRRREAYLQTVNEDETKEEKIARLQKALKELMEEEDDNGM